MTVQSAIRTLVFTAAALFLAASGAEAQETRRATPGVSAPAARIADLAWLAGSWAGEGTTGPAREVYSPVMGGQIAGHFVQTKAGGVAFMEMMSIVETGGSLEYRLKHFNADLTGWEEKNDMVRFPLVAVAEGVWYFDGLTIRRDGADAMIVTVRIDDRSSGGSREAPFRYRRER